MPPLVNSEMMSVVAAVVLDRTPENVGLVLSLPMVSETLSPLLVLLVTLPAPASEPTLWLKPFSRNVALEATETPENRRDGVGDAGLEREAGAVDVGRAGVGVVAR